MFIANTASRMTTFSNATRAYDQLTDFADAFSLVYVPNSFPKHKNRIVKNNTKNTASVGELNKR